MPEEPKEDSNISTPNNDPAMMIENQPDLSQPSVKQPSEVVDEAAASFDMESTESLTPTTAEQEPAEPSTFSPFGEPVEPVGIPSTSPIQPVTAELTNPDMKPKKSKKKFIIIGIIAVVFAGLVGGGVFAYNMYQNPQKVITDAIMNAVTAKTAIFTGTMAVDNDQFKVAVELNAKADETNGDLSAKLNVTYQGKEYSIDAAAVYAESGDLYVKATNLDDVKALAKEQFAAYDSTGAFDTAIDKIAAKIDGVWIKISSKDLKSYSEEASTAQTCVSDALNKFKDDKQAISEISDVYEKNQFILIKKDLGTKDGSMGYEITSDDAKAKTFATGLETTTIYKTLHDCDESFTVDAKDLSATADDSATTETVQVWVDTWSHQFTKIDISGESDGTKINLSLLPDFNKPVTVDIPSSSTTLTQLQADFTDIFTEATAQ